LPNTSTPGEAATSCSNPARLHDRQNLQWMPYPNPAMSINWRASLVPAAAVIPAPMAYTNIAAVKTLVVDLRAWGCRAARADGPKGGLASPDGLSVVGTQPPAGCPRARRTWDRSHLLQAYFIGRRRGFARNAGTGIMRHSCRTRPRCRPRLSP